MKKIFLILFAFAAVTAVTTISSCSKDDNTGQEQTPPEAPEDPEDPDDPTPPATRNVTLTADPNGQSDLSTHIIVTGDWTVEGEETYTWATPSPASGTNDADIVFDIKINEEEVERSAIFNVTQNTNVLYKITINQGIVTGNVAAKDLEFLKAIVEGNMLGDQTPTIANWKAVPADAFPGITLEVPEGASDGLMCVTRIYDAPFTDLPTTLDLPELTYFKLIRRDADNKGPLEGKKLPSTWNTPKCTDINTAFSYLTGTIPQGIADDPELRCLLIDGNNFYGALPHYWASTKLEVMIANQGNEKLGYLVPAQLDVLINQYDESGNRVNYQNDLTQYKFMNGGNNFQGFEKGWGQARYEKYDPNATVGDKETWSDHRLFQEYSDFGYDVGWKWYFTDIASCPKVLSDWDQSAADAYTASCE